MDSLTNIANSGYFQKRVSAREDTNGGYYNIRYPTLDRILVAHRINNVVADGPKEKKLEEDAIESLPGYSRHSLVILCSYGDPLKQFKDLKIRRDDNIIQEPIDIFSTSYDELKSILNELRGKEGIISLVINDGKYQLMYSGIRLPEGSEENILALYKNKYNISTIEELKNELSLTNKELGGFKTQAILYFSIKHSSGDYAPWFLKVNGNGPQIFYKGKIL